MPLSQAPLPTWIRLDRTLLSVQYLRAVAALVILGIHGAPWLSETWATALSMALDLFFLISGFLVVVICDDDTRPWPFFRDRLLRIVPLYWVITLASFFIIYSGILEPTLNPLKLAFATAHGDWNFLFHSLVFFPVQGPFEADLHPLVPQGWTLNYEMMLYGLFAMALWLPRRYVAPVATCLFAVLVLAGFLIKGGPAFRFWTSPFIFEFVFGLWVGVAWQRRWNFGWLYLALLVAWVPLMAVTARYFLGWPFNPGRMAFLPIVLTIFLLFVAIDCKEGRMPKLGPARLLGDASYSIYLFHFIPIVILDRLSHAFPIGEGAYFMGVFGGGLIGGLVCYYAIELPIKRKVKQVRSARQASALPAGRQHA